MEFELFCLNTVAEKAINKYPNHVKRYNNGETALLGLFVGEAMKLTKGSANPHKLNEIVKFKLDKYSSGETGSTR